MYSNGVQAYDSFAPSISADGRFVAFYSWSFDSNGSPDVYVHERPGPDPGTMSFTLKPASLAFGDQTLLTERTKTFKLSNTGTAVLPLQSVQLRGEDTSQFILLNQCGVWVAVGGSCDIDVVFRPTSVGAKLARLRVVAGSNSIRVRDLTGTGVRSAFSVQPTSLAFGRVTVGAMSALQTVVITNIATGVLPINSVRIWGEQRGQFTLTHDCPSELPVGGKCTARVAFRPTTVPQIREPQGRRVGWRPSPMGAAQRYRYLKATTGCQVALGVASAMRSACGPRPTALQASTTLASSRGQETSISSGTARCSTARLLVTRAKKLGPIQRSAIEQTREEL